MEYRIKFQGYHDLFAVPNTVVDQHLKSCGAVSLKVLLFALRTASPAIDLGEAGKALGLSVAEVKDAMSYWVQCGVVECINSEGLRVKENTAASTPAPIRRAPAKPSAIEIARLCEQDEVLASVIQEAQNMLGKLLTQADIATLVSIYDWAGMSADVLLMLLEYCRSIGKTNMRYVEKVAISWLEHGITSHEMAERYIQQLTRTNEQENLVKQAFGIYDRALVSKEKKYIESWFQELHFDLPLIRLAYERTIEAIGKLSFPYVNSILQSWHNKGIRTVQQAAQEQRPSFQPAGEPKKTSYDLDEIEKMITYGKS